MPYKYVIQIWGGAISRSSLLDILHLFWSHCSYVREVYGRCFDVLPLGTTVHIRNGPDYACFRKSRFRSITHNGHHNLLKS